jgi:hypothetical protein
MEQRERKHLLFRETITRAVIPTQQPNSENQGTSHLLEAMEVPKREEEMDGMKAGFATIHVDSPGKGKNDICRRGNSKSGRQTNQRRRRRDRFRGCGRLNARTDPGCW